jgi:hypothetical protein
MKTPADHYTIDAFASLPRGRPRNPNAKSNAQRQREFRQRRKLDSLIIVTRNEKRG